jgi:hypothetical protein
VKKILVGFVAALAVAVALPLAASASRPGTLQLHFSLTSNIQQTAGKGKTQVLTADGTWATVDANTSLTAMQGKGGTASETVRLTGKGRVVHGRKLVMSGTGNSFVIQFNGKTSDGGTTVKGHYVIKNGKGDYRGLHGTGKVQATLTLDAVTHAVTGIDATYTGKAHLDGQSGGSADPNGKAKGKDK